MQEREWGPRHFGKTMLLVSRSQAPQKKSSQKDDGKIAGLNLHVFVSVTAQTIQTLLCEKVKKTTPNT